MNMIKTEKQKLLLSIVLAMMIYMGYFIILYYVSYKKNYLIPMVEVNESNILIKATVDFLSIYLSTFFFFLLFRKYQQYVKFNKVAMVSFVLYLSVSIHLICKYDFSLRGFYAIFFYFGTGFVEEMIFRQYVYNGIKIATKPIIAVIISGGVWGAMHGILPIITNNYSLWKNILSVTNEISGGIILGWLYIYIMRKTKSVWTCIFIHAMLDFFGHIYKVRF